MQIYSDKLFENRVDFIEIFEPEEIQNGFLRLENLRKKNLHIIGYMRYDLSKSSKYPLMYFEAYDKVEKYIPSNFRIEMQEFLSNLKYQKMNILGQ